MNRWLLAAVGLLGSAGFATADYVILVANVASEKELRTLPGGMAGVPGMPRGVPGGGVRGGFQGVPGGGVPGMGNRGMPGGMPGVGGMPGGMRGLPGGMRGMPGGMRGMPGGMRGLPGGMMEATDIDDVPYFILAVAEVKSGRGGDVTKQFQKGQQRGVVLAQVKLTDRLGEEYEKENRTVYLVPQTSFGETHVLTESNGKPLPTVHQQFDKQFDDLKTKGKASTEDIFKLAEWTLSHGLIDKFPQVMDKLVESDKGHPAAVAYLKIKADLDRPPSREDASFASIKKALNDYKEVPGQHHYAVLYNSAVAASEAKSHLDQLENSFRGFYYWFALKGVALPLPDHRLVAVVTGEKDFNQFHKALASGPVVIDGFFARRENVAVMASKRQDESYDALSKYYQTWEDKGFHRADVLLKKPTPAQLLANGGQTFAEAQMLALMLKSLEKEAELATVSHDASRQLLFASGLLPGNVAVPEWLLFGMGSFFETPLQSPWPSLGAPSAYYLPRWQELKGKGFEKTPGQTLRRVITDAYFRSVPPEGKAGSDERRLHDDALRKARTASWSLAYFLATSERRFEGLMRYFKELGKMPRDIELDDEILLGCFARAFGLVDRDNKLDNARLDSLAREWYSHMDNVHFESEATIKKIREVFRDKLKEMQDQANKSSQEQVDPQTGQPIPPGTLPQQGPRPGGVPQPKPPQGQRPGGYRPQPQPQPQPPPRVPAPPVPRRK